MSEKRGVIEITQGEYIAEGTRLFGENMRDWRVVCPSCKHVASIRDYEQAGAPEGAAGYSCIGRWLPTRSDAFSGKPGPCNYAGGGLFSISPIKVLLGDGKSIPAFAFDGMEVVRA